MLRADKTIVFDTDVILPFEIFDGDSLTDAELLAQIAAGTAPLKDVSGWELGFYVRKKPNSADPALIYKNNSGSPGGITVMGTFGGSPEQTVEVLIEDTDTYDPDVDPVLLIKEGQYVYALKRLDAGAETVLVYGYLNIMRTGAWE